MNLESWQNSIVMPEISSGGVSQTDFMTHSTLNQLGTVTSGTAPSDFIWKVADSDDTNASLKIQEQMLILCHLLVDVMPQGGLGEMLETLVDLRLFYNEREMLSAPAPRIHKRHEVRVVGRTVSPPIYLENSGE